MSKDSANRQTNKESPSTQDHAQNPGLKEGFNNSSGFGQKEQGDVFKESTKRKDGCLPKLFILLMPFISIAAYLSLRAI